ncbi:hypothetical protein PVL29_016396 [Vitis rotundifolia]|uniref:Cyclin N-terminal domain-containing protein n=2 Tax=Vitis rotundifolia TaxID=103349 RepID=A0AA39DHK4_VITRO|nr:hypothetical protein PVL29_016396 [Vitis rotundifolia]
MASRAVVPRDHQQPRGEAVAGNGKQKKNVAAERRNRQALGDIGNLVTVGDDGKPQPQISRPITRGFCAQLLAKAKEAAAAENNKKAVRANVDGAQLRANVDGALLVTNGAAAGKGPEAEKAAQKKVAVKTKPETVIELSSDTEEVKKEKPINTKKTGEGSSRKKVQTMTSILTSRSKAACGLTDNKPKEQIVDIDAADANNELAVVEYVEDIYKFYKLIESESHIHDYMDSQPEMNEKMRSILVDWLIEVHHKFELMPETLYLTINIIDRFLSVKTVPRRELQLVGISAMLIASKYEEIWAPEVNDFVCISDRAYSDQQIRNMEKAILGRLEWTLTVPTPYVFLVRFIKASIPDQEMEHMVYFYAELGLANYATMMYCSSMLAASSVYAARCALNKSPVWDETLKAYTGFSEAQLLDCAKLLASFHSMAAENKLIKAVYRKYSQPHRSGVVFRPPAKVLLAAS